MHDAAAASSGPGLGFSELQSSTAPQPGTRHPEQFALRAEELDREFKLASGRTRELFFRNYPRSMCTR